MNIDIKSIVNTIFSDMKDIAAILNVVNKVKNGEGTATFQIDAEEVLNLLTVTILFTASYPYIGQSGIIGALDEFCKMKEKDLIKLLDNLEDISHEGN